LWNTGLAACTISAGVPSAMAALVELIASSKTVVRTALENAISVASLLLLTEATVTDIPEDKNQLNREQYTEA
jgi:chaperonin GroEL